MIATLTFKLLLKVQPLVNMVSWEMHSLEKIECIMMLQTLIQSEGPASTLENRLQELMPVFIFPYNLQ